MIIGSLFRQWYYPFTTPSAGLVEGMGSLSLDSTPPLHLLPYVLPSPSLCLTLDKGLPLPALHPSLPPAVTIPPPSLTPLPAPQTHSMSKQECSEQCKDQMDLYGPTKRGQYCRPSSPITKAKQESLSLFWKLEREVGLQKALDCLQKVLDSGREELEHDAMSCRDCWMNVDIVYCERSKYHPNHLYHHCPSWQNCYCLAPEYNSDLSCYLDLNVL